MVRGEGKMFSNRPPSVELTKKEKLQRIRELIRRKRLPVWCDPYFPHWTPPKDALAKNKEQDPHLKRQEELKSFREWYLSKDTGQFEEKRQKLREKAQVGAELHYDEMEIPDRCAELQNVLKNDELHIQKELREYYASQPSDLDVKRHRTKMLKDKHQREEAAFVQKQRERQWRSSIAAEEIRSWEAKAHKEQATRDLEELQYFKLLEKLEDAEVDMYFAKLGLARIAKERKEMNERELEHQELEWRGQNALIEQMLEHARKKEEASKQKEVEKNERIHFEEHLRFEAFKDRFEDHNEKLKLREELTQQEKSNYMILEKKTQDTLEKKQMAAWQKQLIEEEDDQNSTNRKLKDALYKRHLEEIAYKEELMEVSQQSQAARIQGVAEYVKEQQYDALYTYLDCLKTRQGLQSRTDKELEYQIKEHAAQRKVKVETKACEREQEKSEQEKYKAFLLQRAAEKLHQQQLSAKVLKEQAADKILKEQQLIAQNNEFAREQEAKRNTEDEYIRKLASQLGFPAPARVKKFSV